MAQSMIFLIGTMSLELMAARIGERRVEADKVEQALVEVGKILKAHMLIIEEQMIRAAMRLKR
jgi:hypothetical protein